MTTPLSISQGGTGTSTSRTAVADAAYTVVATDRVVAYTAITAARVVTLPAASAFPAGCYLLVLDENGACSATNTITVARAGSDTINGTTSAVIASAYGFVALESDGASKWTIIDQSTASMAQQSAANVAITGGAINGASIGATVPAAGSFTTLTQSGAFNDTAFNVATPAAAGTVSVANATGVQILNPAATLASLTVAFPPTPTNGLRFEVLTTQSITTLTCSASTGTIKNAPTTLAAGAGFEYIYVAASTTWFRLR